MSTELATAERNPVVTDITAVAFDRHEMACAKGLASGCIQFTLLPKDLLKASTDNGEKKGKKVQFLIHERSYKVTSLSFGKHDSRVFCAAAYCDGLFCVYENVSGSWRHILTQREREQKVAAVSWSEDGRLAAAYHDHVTIFEMRQDLVGSRKPGSQSSSKEDSDSKKNGGDEEEPNELVSVEDVDVAREHKPAFITFFSNSMFAVLSEDGFVQIYATRDGMFQPYGDPIQIFVSGHGAPLCISGWCADPNDNTWEGAKIAVAYRDNAVKEEVVQVIDVTSDVNRNVTEIWDRIWDGRIVALTWRGMGNEIAITKARVLSVDTSAYIQLPDGTWVASKKSLF